MPFPPRDGAPDSPVGGPSLHYMPALDGLRAFAVAAVLCYHGGISWLPGGFFGVDLFFVLSGFLITSLLLGEWTRTGTIRLRRFWGRRARRLLPALLAVVVFVVCYATFAVPAATYPGIRGDALSAIFYVANWHFILSGSNYFAQSALTSPLTHTWSLAIEEQFYLLWPLVVLAILRYAPRPLRALWWVSVIGALASALEMALLLHAGASATRLYYGTDTHAQSLLVGTALAVGLARLRPHEPGAASASPWRPSRRSRTALALLGAAGVVGCALMWTRVAFGSVLLFQGGFLLAAVSAGTVLLSAVSLPHGLLARALSVAPLRYIGRISYGIYLWHYPLFIWLDGARTGLEGLALFALRCAVTCCVATASFFLLERPIRHGNLLRGRLTWAAAPVAVALSAAVVVAVTSGAWVAASASPTAEPHRATGVPAVPGAPLRVLLIGDSTALTLGVAIAGDAKTYGVTLEVKAILGCGVTEGRQVRPTGKVSTVARPCNSSPAPPGTPLVQHTADPYGGMVTSPDAERWTAWYRHWVATFDPNVVILLAGRWEVVTRTFEGHWTNILHPRFARYVEQQLERTIRLASAHGAHVELMTAPCYEPGEQPDGQPWPTGSPSRLDVYNRLVREAAARFPGIASVFDLDALVCPGGSYHQSVDGVQVRLADGVHFTPNAGAYLGPRIWPSIVRVGLIERRAGTVRQVRPPSPGGASTR